MKILYFTGGYSPHDRRFLGAVVEQGMDVSLLSFHAGAMEHSGYNLPDGVQALGGIAKSTRLDWFALPRLVRQVQSTARRIQPDVIHAGPMHLGAFLAAAAHEHPLVSMSWGSDLLADARSGKRRLMARFTLSRSDAFIGDCQAVRKSAIELGMAHERIVTFPWGVNLEQFYPSADRQVREQLGWRDATVLISTRSWEPLYGVDILVQAFLKASRQESSLRLLLVGGGSQKALLEGMIEDARTCDKVHLVERVSESELPRYYNSGDLYVSVSHSDGSSVSLLEAMACGLPVLVSDIPGNREWVEHGANGWLFPDGDVEGLTQNILMLARNRDGLKPAGMLGREITEQRADWQKNHVRMFQAYSMAIDHAKRNRK